MRVYLLSHFKYEQNTPYTNALSVAVYSLAHMLPSFHPDLLDRVQTARAATQNDDAAAISSCQAHFH